MKILAKSNPEITLSQHTKDVLESLSFIKKYIPEKLYKFIEIAVLFHDIGKVIPAFQIKTLGNKDYSPWDVAYEIPHNFFSVFWIDFEKIPSFLPPSYDKDTLIRYIVSSIAYHHWREGYEKYLKHSSKEFINFCKKVLNWENDLKENLKKELSGLNSKINPESLTLNKKWLNGIINGRSFTSYAIPPYKFDYEPLRQGFNKDWISISGFLQRCDHFASYCEEEGENVQSIEIEPVSFDSIKSKIVNNLKSTEEKIWQIRKVENLRDKNVVLIAPTGSGKTEFAFLWAAGRKLFFTLPLRNAVNAIYNRSVNYFGDDKCGLLHSDADIYLFKRDTEDDGESYKTLEMARQLSFPVLVSTGDQIFPSALRYPGYEKFYSTLSYSNLVIDEIQAYDPRAVAIIVKMIEDVVKLGGRFLLMTATLPKFVQEKIEERIGKDNFEFINLYEDERYQISKHQIEIKEGDIENETEEILSKARAGNRLLVILNTVDKAQKIYSKLKENKGKEIYLKLIHSKFILSDRKTIEEEIVGRYDDNNNWIPGTFSNPKPNNEKDGKILVATQIVEASLDIDADILYTELAPVDSLIQRMGRVLRRFKEKGTNNYSNSSEPNIMIFYQKPNENKSLSSGAGIVYQNDSLVFTLALLFSRTGKIKLGDLNELKKKYWTDEEKSKAKNQRNSLKNFLEELFKKIENSSGKNILTLPENEKDNLVKTLYDLLPKESEYMKKFNQTLDILDAGYMSEKKSEALRIFREIYTVPAVPNNKLEDFKKDIKEFVRNPAINYTSFKIEILSRYVLNIDMRKYLHHEGLKSVSYIVDEIELDGNIEKRIKSWLNDIYVFDGEYSSEKGLSYEKTDESISNPSNMF